ncbi:uncharacterized protein [Ranitomeya imitator]|uniref:uncharacterized protein n=1 Tax=Ranitomeya imitator TaxID=111125 RepID=UPI0037E83216
MCLLVSNKEIEKDRKEYDVGVIGEHTNIEVRESCGAYHTLYSELNANPDNFPEYTRMSQETFWDLLGRVQGAIRRQDTQLRRAIPAEERLLVTLRFLATGESLSSLHFQYRLGISTLSGIVVDTCRSLWNVLWDECIPYPPRKCGWKLPTYSGECVISPTVWEQWTESTYRLPNPPDLDPSSFNYKKYFSVVLMVIAYADCRFIAVDIGASGRGNDSQTFKNSDMGRHLYGKNINFPMP